MRIYAIRNDGIVKPSANSQKVQTRKSAPSLSLDEPKADTVSFKSKTLKGAGIGSLCGVAALGAISFLSGGLATPLAFGLYAATMGTAGGMLGNVLDKIDEEEKELRDKIRKNK